MQQEAARPAEVAWRRAAPGAAVVAAAMLLIVLAGAWRTGVGVPVDAVLGLVFPVLGTFVLARGGPARIGALCLVPALGAVAYAGDAYAQRPGPLAAAAWAAWLGLWAWAPAVLVPVTLLILLVPDGAPPTPRWRPLAPVTVLVVAAFTAVLAVSPQERFGLANPLAAGGPAGPVFGVLLAAVAVIAACCAVALVRRLLAASGTVRLQLAWVTAGALVFAATTFGNTLLPDPAAGLVEAAGALTFPLAVAVAMLWHRLYETDPVLRRGLVYLLCTLVLTVTYVAVVAGAGVLVRERGAGPAAVAAAVTALAVAPVRRLLGRVVDRALYGRRGDPYAVILDLDRRLIGSTGPEETLAAVVESAIGALRLPYAQVELGDPGAPLMCLSAGDPAPTARELPVVFQGTTLGRLRLAARRAGEGFDARDDRMLTGIAAHAAAAVAAAHRELELRQARTELVATREEERRRLRRDLHDGLGPIFAGLGFTADAAANSVRADPDRAERLLATVREQAGAASALVRQLSRRLRPPELDHLGLAGALRDAADRFPGLAVEVEVHGDTAGLDAATEVAAYLVATEALTNTARHAGARRAHVRLEVTPGELRCEIGDDGAGVRDDVAAGVGLTAMRERAAELGGSCTIEGTGAGTRVRLWLPRGRSGP